MQHITPKHYYPTRNRPLRCIVIHTMEAPEGPQTAENVAEFFARGSVVASAHACVDQDSLVPCLPPTATAFAAPGLNADGYQIELAGYARQTPQEWQDDASQSMLRIAAAHCREIANSAGIPLVHLTDDQVKAGAAGFTDHATVSRVYGLSDHWDPGPHFPWTQFMEMLTTTSTTSAKEKTPMITIIATTTPWGTRAHARLHALNGARAIDEQEAASAVKTYGYSELPWDWWNLEIRQCWKDHEDHMKALGKELTETIAQATARVIASATGKEATA